LGYEVFAGNRHDSTTVEEIVTKMEKQQIYYLAAVQGTFMHLIVQALIYGILLAVMV